MSILSLVEGTVLGLGKKKKKTGEKGETFHVVREKAGELFKECRRQHRSFNTNSGKAPGEGKEGPKLKHLLQMSHLGRERPP